MDTLPVIRNLGGCGGTLLARLFGADAANIVLSETNPRSANLFDSLLNPLAQVRKWRPDLAECIKEFDVSEIGYPPRFGELVERLHAELKRRRMRLMIRDFNYADFIGVPFIWPVPRDFSLDAAVGQTFRIADFLFVRHPADQLASLWTHKPLANVLTAEHFLDGYNTLLEARPHIKLFKYERFTAEPEGQFRLMCEALEVPFDAAALTNFTKVKSVTGSLARLADSQIRPPLAGGRLPQALRKLKPLGGYVKLLQRLGYEDKNEPQMGGVWRDVEDRF